MKACVFMYNYETDPVYKLFLITTGYCPKGQSLCNSVTRHCFTPTIDLCNGVFNCPLGEDEVGCGKR